MDKTCQRHRLTATRFAFKEGSEGFEYLCEHCATKTGSSESFPMSSFNMINEFGTRNYQILYSRVKEQRDSIARLRALNSQFANTAKVEIAKYLAELNSWVETRKCFFDDFLTEAEREVVALLTRPFGVMSNSSKSLLSLSPESGSQLVEDLYQVAGLKKALESYYEFMVSSPYKKQELIEELVNNTEKRVTAQGMGEIGPNEGEDAAPSETSTKATSSDPAPRRPPSIPPSESDLNDAIEDFTDPVPAEFPLFVNGDRIKRLDRSLKSSSEPIRCTGLESEFTFSEYIAFVATGPNTYFIIGAGASKRMTAHLNIETGLGIPFPELDKERGSCGLLYYKEEIYLFGGYGGSKYGLTRNLVMNPPFQNTDKISVASEERKWKGLAEMPTARYGFTPARYGKKVFLVGGWDSAGRIDQYDLKLNRYKNLPTMQGPQRVASSCVCGTTLVTISQGTMWKWDLTRGDSGYSEHEEKTLTEPVEDLWSNMIPICLEDKIYYMHIPGSRMIVLTQSTGQIDIRKLR